MPKTSEQWLEEAAPKNKQTVFKLFLGYAPGVAKTFNMLMCPSSPMQTYKTAGMQH
jgi:K+-sensing histidine kinase KdpD